MLKRLSKEKEAEIISYIDKTIDDKVNSIHTNNKLRADAFKQFEPLIMKISAYYAKKMKEDYKTVYSNGCEGFVYAMNTFKKTTLNFKQYAAWCIKNIILTNTNKELDGNRQTIKKDDIKYYIKNESFTYDYEDYRKNKKMGLQEGYSQDFEIEREYIDANEIYSLLYSKLLKRFDARKTKMFCMYYGIFESSKKMKIIAKRYNISIPSVSIILKGMCKYIKEDGELRNALHYLFRY